MVLVSIETVMHDAFRELHNCLHVFSNSCPAFSNKSWPSGQFCFSKSVKSFTHEALFKDKVKMKKNPTVHLMRSATNGRAISMQNSLRRKVSSLGVQNGNHFRLAAFTVYLILLCVLTGLAIAQFSQRSVTSYGIVKVVGVSLYWDYARTNDVTSIDWGTVIPGASVDRCVYVRNNGTAAGTLSISYGTFTPAAAASYLTLTWNCSSYVLSRNEVTCAKLTLSVQPNITGVQDFSFTILIQATA